MGVHKTFSEENFFGVKFLFKKFIIFQYKKLGALLRELLFKRIWQHRCFPVDFAKFLKTPTLQNISIRLQKKKRKRKKKESKVNEIQNKFENTRVSHSRYNYFFHEKRFWIKICTFALVPKALFSGGAHQLLIKTYMSFIYNVTTYKSRHKSMHFIYNSPACKSHYCVLIRASARNGNKSREKRTKERKAQKRI